MTFCEAVTSPAFVATVMVPLVVVIPPVPSTVPIVRSPALVKAKLFVLPLILAAKVPTTLAAFKVTGPALLTFKLVAVKTLLPCVMLPLLVNVKMAAGDEIAVLCVMLPLVLLPIRKVPAVIVLISVFVNPSTPAASAPPSAIATFEVLGCKVTMALPAFVLPPNVM